MSPPPRRNCFRWCWRMVGCTSWTTAAGTPTWSKSSWRWSKEATMAAELTLQPVARRGRAGGFRNLLRNELASFWGTPTWLIQVGTWLVFGPGFLLLFLLTESLGAAQDGHAPRAAIELAARVLPATAGTLVAIAAVILAQGVRAGQVPGPRLRDGGDCRRGAGGGGVRDRRGRGRARAAGPVPGRAG